MTVAPSIYQKQDLTLSLSSALDMLNKLPNQLTKFLRSSTPRCVQSEEETRTKIH